MDRNAFRRKLTTFDSTTFVVVPLLEHIPFEYLEQFKTAKGRLIIFAIIAAVLVARYEKKNIDYRKIFCTRSLR